METKTINNSKFKVINGHPYYRLPDNLPEETIRVLHEAVEYKHLTGYMVSDYLYEYLEEKYHIERFEYGQAKAIFNNMEINLTVLDNHMGKHIWLFTHPENGENDPVNMFYKELNIDKVCHTIGMAKVLDSNHGGKITKEYLEAASVIMFG